MFFDPKYFLFVGPAMLLALWAQWKVKSTYQRYAQVPTRNGINGLETADQLIRRYAPPRNALQVEGIAGELTDHYDPRTKTLALSQSSQFNSVASVAVVAHEFGHAMQDEQGDAMLQLRGNIVTLVHYGSGLAPWLFMAGMWFHAPTLAWVGVLGFSLATVFSLVTLPVEFDASRRALVYLSDSGILRQDELPGAKKVLDAAALTYVAGAATSISALVYYALAAAGMSSRERD
jgi:Zn-dependent membrane protease YugP